MLSHEQILIASGVLVLFLLGLCVWGYAKRKLVFLPMLGRSSIRMNQFLRAVSLAAFAALLSGALLAAAADTFEENLTGVLGFGLDESRSAAAENEAGVARIERERAAAIALNSFPHVYSAIYGFTDRAFSHSSFSQNHDHFRDTVNYLVAVEAVPGEGSDHGYALLNILDELHKECVRRNSEDACVAVLISDGENIGSQDTLFEALRFAQKTGIKIVTIGVGEDKSVPIPIYNKRGELLGYEVDGRGNRYLTKLDETAMRSIAVESGGIYVRENDLEKARKFIESNLKKEKVKADDSNSPLTALLLIAALVPLVLYVRLSKI